ncbi:MAG: beta-lactamase family protein [Nitrospirota bacterium]|nr:beta-lactamase family protein [Nitrospirota bacterium]
MNSPPKSSADPVAIMREGVADGTFPGGVLWVAAGGKLVQHTAVGTLDCSPAALPVVPDTRFDLASVTKAMATASTAMHMAEEGLLDPETPLSRLLPELTWADQRHTLFHLLTHSAGLPAWKPFFEMAREHADEAGSIGSPRCRLWILKRVMAEPPELPPGQKSVYSDLGFILLGEILERLGGKPLDQLFRERVASPLGLVDTAYNRGNDPHWLAADTVAATAHRPWRGGVIRGTVDDDNAFAMGGVSGHAGLFGPAAEAGRWGQALLDAWHGRSDWISRATARVWMTRNDQVPGSSWALGFDTPWPPPTTAGPHFSKSSVGHLGFTGTSVWVDLEREWVVVLLTNRVHPDPDNMGIKRFRPRLHESATWALPVLPSPPGE